MPTPERKDLRACIAQAADGAAVAACERTAQSALKEQIERWTAAINARLNQDQRRRFERNIAKWKAWLASEQALLKTTLKRRKDGLGPQLLNGAVTRLYEDRERQLREHLHNLIFAAKRG